MTKTLLHLLDQAAQLRSCGASWGAIGKRVNRKASTCRSWQRRHPEFWQPLYNEAAAARSLELGNEAEGTLRSLLRDEDKRWQIKSAEVLMKHRWRPPVEERHLVNPEHWFSNDKNGSNRVSADPDDDRGHPILWDALFKEFVEDNDRLHEKHGLPKTVTVADWMDEFKDCIEWNQKSEDHPEQQEAHDAEWLRKYRAREAERERRKRSDSEDLEAKIVADEVKEMEEVRAELEAERNRLKGGGGVSLGLLALVGVAALAIGGVLGKIASERGRGVVAERQIVEVPSVAAQSLNQNQQQKRISRHQALASLGGLTSPDLLRLRAAETATEKPVADTAVIHIWCDGGPSQLETYDPKPDAPDVAGKTARETLDLSRESAQTREKYGNKVERGHPWGLIEDLHDRGLNKKVAVLIWGEFGRTPRISKGGRDRWPSSMSVLLAGGGMKMGQVIGATNDKGEKPKDRPLHPNDVWATIYKMLGIDQTQAFINPAGRPIPNLTQGEPIAELL